MCGGITFRTDLCVYSSSNNSYTLCRVWCQNTPPQKKKYDPALKTGYQLATFFADEPAILIVLSCLSCYTSTL